MHSYARYLTRDGADLMFERVNGLGRRWLTGQLVQPFGRGINLQIQVSDVDGPAS